MCNDIFFCSLLLGWDLLINFLFYFYSVIKFGIVLICSWKCSKELKEAIKFCKQYDKKTINTNASQNSIWGIVFAANSSNSEEFLDLFMIAWCHFVAKMHLTWLIKSRMIKKIQMENARLNPQKWVKPKVICPSTQECSFNCNDTFKGLKSLNRE